MKNTAQIMAVAGALLIGASFVPAYGLDLSLGGVDATAGSSGSGGTTASVGSGGSTGSATVGGGSNVASVSTGAAGTGGNVNVGGGSGQLITTDNNGGTTNANVNLGLASLGAGGVNDTVNGITGPAGNALDGVNVPGVPGAGGPGSGLGGSFTQVSSQFAALGAGQQQQLRLQCRSILANPGAFDSDLVALCGMISRIR